MMEQKTADDFTKRIELAELVLRGNNEGIWDWNIGTNSVYYSPSLKAQLGYSDSELENKTETLEMLMHPDDLEKYKSELNGFLSSSSDVYSSEYRLRHKDGSYRWIWARGAAIRDRNGKVCRMAGSHADITEKKDLATDFQNNKLAQIRILATIKDAYILYSLNKFVDINDNFIEMTGYAREDLEHLHLSDLVSEESKEEYLKSRDQLYRDGHVFTEMICKRNDGSEFHVESVASLLNRDPFLSVFFARDITERKNSEKKLLHFQELMRYIIEHNRIAVAVHDKNLNYMYVSQPYYKLFNLPENEDIIGKHHYDVLKTMPDSYRIVHQRVLNGEIIRSNEDFSVFDSGKFVVWECRPWYEEDNSIGGFILYIEDITERKEIEQLLINEKEQFKATLLSVSDGVISTDIQGNIKVMNPVAEKLTGWLSCETKGVLINNVLRIISEQTRIPDEDFLMQVLVLGKVIEYSDKLLLSKTGNEVPVEISIAPIKHDNGNISGAVFIFRDVSEKKAEQRKIEFLSYNDVLTGLYNRRYIEESIRVLDTPENLPLSLFSIDVDGLKLANDAFGHELGDQLLKTVAGILKISCRPDDIIGRVGGDEFCILMTKTDEMEAAILKQRILNEISNLKLNPVMVSLAIGFAVKRSPEDDIKSIMMISDNRMYQDKIKSSKIMRSQTIQMALEYINSCSGKEKIHTDNVSYYCQAIARAMNLSEKAVQDIKLAAELHDIGKIMVPSQILDKTGILSKDELNIVKRHPEIGYQMLKTVEEYAHLSEYVLYHHERWDGISGRP